MLYKLFLVEDEVITRDGIRESIDWAAAGYHFCGEASDGEMALPLILEQRPEVVITDIKMPFMDGLQLCRLLKVSLPETKIIILSGHDEFKYAQEAIQIGVTEYLLKPVSAQELVGVLRKVAQQINVAQQETERMRTWQSQMADQRSILRERYLLHLVMGLLSPSDAIEQARTLELDLLARCYQVMVVRIAHNPSIPTTGLHDTFAAVDGQISAALATSDTIMRFKKAPEETVLIRKGNDREQLAQTAQHVARGITEQIERNTAYRATIGIGETSERLGTVAQSFAQAMRDLDSSAARLHDSATGYLVKRSELAKPHTAAFTQLLRSGSATEIDQSFAAYLAPLNGMDRQSRVLIDYIFTDVALLLANMLQELGIDAAEIMRDLDRLEAQASTIIHLDQIKDAVRGIVARTLVCRDQRAHGHQELIAKARAYIATHYASHEISLSSVAAHVMLSPSYFSVVFSREVGETFIEYLTQYKIHKAKELLSTSDMPSSEIAYQVGYDNPRYFYAVFRKVVGISPNKFRHTSNAIHHVKHT